MSAQFITVPFFTSHIVHIKRNGGDNQIHSNANFTSHIVHIKLQWQRIYRYQRAGFTSHIVHIKPLVFCSLTCFLLNLYIPHSSYKTSPALMWLQLPIYFTSHIVHIKPAFPPAKSPKLAELYIPHSSYKTPILRLQIGLGD